MKTTLTILAATALSVNAKTIDIDWIIKSKNKPMQSIRAAVGDTLIFSWRGRHNVFLSTDCDGLGAQRWDSYQCPQKGTAGWGTNLGESSPVEYTIREEDGFKEGDFLCFACEVGGHCSAGQHTTLLIDNHPGKIFDIDWIIKSKNEKMQKITAAAGDKLVFSWKGRHNVFLAAECDGSGAHKWDDYTCPGPNDDWGEDLGQVSPVEWIVPDSAVTGDFFCFACEISGHCSAGQHTTLEIKNPGQAPPAPVHEIEWIVQEKKSMQSLVASPGDILRFVWDDENEFHNVFEMVACDGDGKHKWDAFTCPETDFEWGINRGQASGVEVEIPLDTPNGAYMCFACQVGQHCRFGQHTTVLVRGKGFEILKEICEGQTNAQNCKACMGKVKGTKCSFKDDRLREKFNCKKIKTAEFCEASGCTVKQNGKCDGPNWYLGK